MIGYREISAKLNYIIIDKPFFFFNLWSIVHFFTGGILMYILTKKLKVKKPFKVLVILLVIYELFELAVIFSGSDLFKGERTLDIFLDVILGLLGGYVYYKYLKR